jgi:hypothetical protein
MAAPVLFRLRVSDPVRPSSSDGVALAIRVQRPRPRVRGRGSGFSPSRAPVGRATYRADGGGGGGGHGACWGQCPGAGWAGIGEGAWGQ